MRKDLPLADLGDFLERPVVAVLATRRSDGEVLLSPVWHEWRDGGFTVWTGADDVKVRHIRRDPRAAIVVCEHEPPYRGVELRGRATVTNDGVGDTARRIAVRYLGSERGEVFAAGGEGDVLIRLEPGDLRVWDFADEGW